MFLCQPLLIPTCLPSLHQFVSDLFTYACFVSLKTVKLHGLCPFDMSVLAAHCLWFWLHSLLCLLLVQTLKHAKKRAYWNSRHEAWEGDLVGSLSFSLLTNACAELSIRGIQSAIGIYSSWVNYTLQPQGKPSNNNFKK